MIKSSLISPHHHSASELYSSVKAPPLPRIAVAPSFTSQYRCNASLAACTSCLSLLVLLDGTFAPTAFCSFPIKLSPLPSCICYQSLLVHLVSLSRNPVLANHVFRRVICTASPAIRPSTHSQPSSPSIITWRVLYASELMRSRILEHLES